MVEPMIMNNTEKPRMKAAEWDTVFVITCLFPAPETRVSKEFPLMKEMYEGKRPREQGDRKERIPAAKAR